MKVCYAQVMVDGMLLTPMPGEDAVDLRRLPNPKDIHGIEVFAGGGVHSAPVRRHWDATNGAG